MEDKNLREKRAEIRHAAMLRVDVDLLMEKVDTYAEMVATRRINAVLRKLAGNAHERTKKLEAKRGTHS